MPKTPQNPYDSSRGSVAVALFYWEELPRKPSPLMTGTKIMEREIDFYAPYRMADGRLVYGAAAANCRVADAGGFNKVAYNLVLTGIQIGYEKALRAMRSKTRR
jgi:hypothetical protein